MPRPKNSVSDRLNAASVALANAVAETEIASRLASFGFDAARLATGRGLLEAASEAVSRQVAAIGASRAAAATTDAAQEVAQNAYQALSQVARAAFRRDRGALASLGLTGAMPRRAATFVTAGLALFDNAAGTKSLAERLTGYGYIAEKLAAERAKVLALIDAQRAQEAANGAAQQATAVRDKALSALDDEISQLRRIAKVALKDTPQLLEKLGIVRRSAPTPAQRQAGKKGAATKRAKKGG